MTVNTAFRLKLKDTQCGFKALKTDIAKKIASKQLINDFAFDVEYIYIAKLNKVSMYELGIAWQDDRESTVSPIKSSLKFFKDLAFIRKNKKKYFFSYHNGADVDSHFSKCKQTIVSSVLIFTLVALFLVFAFTKNINNHPHSSSQHDNLINERFNDKLIDIVEQRIDNSGFTSEKVTTINAVIIEENYPTNFSLSIACHSEENVYIYQLADYPYLNVNNDEDTALEYLLNHPEFSDDAQDVNMAKYQLIEEANCVNHTYEYITYSNRFSGYYIHNNVYQVYFDELNNNDDPFVGAAFTGVDQNDQLYSYYCFLNN